MDPDHRFGAMTVSWMRKQMGLRTRFFPEQAPPLHDGVGRFDAWRYASTTWGNIAYVAFVAICLGAATLMFGVRPLAPGSTFEWGHLARMAGIALVALGMTGLGAAWRSWRGSRDPVLVVALDGPVVEVGRLEPVLAALAADALRRPAHRPGPEVWIVAASGFSPAALAAAWDRAARCFSAEAGSFVERARSTPPPSAPNRAA